MDDDFEDLLRDEGDPEFNDIVQDSSMDIINKKLVLPSENELRLGRRVLDLEKERDDLAKELAALKARCPTYNNPTVTVDLPSGNAPDQPIEIPSALVPLLAVLRSHISELTRDNQALRYTFLGQAVPKRGPITQSLTPVVPQATTTPIQPEAPGPELNHDIKMASNAGGSSPNTAGPAPLSASGLSQVGVGAGRLDLEKVLERVRGLVLENEQLGEMVLEAGRAGDEEEWQRALDDSKSIIESLDSDLSQHLATIQSTRSELASYKARFGPLTPAAIPASHAISASAPVQSRSPFAGGRGGSKERDGRGGGNFGMGRGGRPVSAGVSNAPTGPGNTGRRPIGGAATNAPAVNLGPVRGGIMGQAQGSRPGQQDERGFKRRR